MAITASRLGSAPVTIDWSNLVHFPTGSAHLSRSAKPDAAATAEVWARLKSRFHAGDAGFFDAPIQNDLSGAQESTALAEKLLHPGHGFTDCLFLGVGGSALGPSTLLQTLSEKRANRLRFHFLENPDPQEWKSTIQELRPASTLICVASKSGGTFETMALFLLALEWIGKDRWSTQIVVITDPVQGDLREFATRLAIPALSIAPSLGGRLSIFSPVGLFPAALAGLSVPDFLLGARQVRDYMEKAPVEKNPLFILGNDLLRHSSQRSIHVCMPYSTRLKHFGAWFVQLWGQSLGKDGKGFMPVAAAGASDRHSLLQLLRDGPDDKITFFMTVDQVSDEVAIPQLPGKPGNILPAFKILEGHSLHGLLRLEYRATTQVLTRRERPHLTFQLDRLDERTLGALHFAFSVLTAFTGALLELDPFDQPGVEEGKQLIRDALSKGEHSTSQTYPTI